MHWVLWKPNSLGHRRNIGVPDGCWIWKKVFSIWKIRRCAVKRGNEVYTDRFELWFRQISQKVLCVKKSIHH